MLRQWLVQPSGSAVTTVFFTHGSEKSQVIRTTRPGATAQIAEVLSVALLGTV